MRAIFKGLQNRVIFTIFKEKRGLFFIYDALHKKFFTRARFGIAFAKIYITFPQYIGHFQGIQVHRR